jgi:hypothetical protein
MAAKISRELDIGDEAPWMPYVHETIEAAHLELISVICIGDNREMHVRTAHREVSRTGS